MRVQYLGPRSTRTPFNSADVESYNQATRTAMDEPAVVAKALLELIESGAPERFLGFPEKFAVRLNGLAPAWLDGAFAKNRRSLPAAPPVRPQGPPCRDATASAASPDNDSHSLMHSTL